MKVKDNKQTRNLHLNLKLIQIKYLTQEEVFQIERIQKVCKLLKIKNNCKKVWWVKKNSYLCKVNKTQHN